MDKRNIFHPYSGERVHHRYFAAYGFAPSDCSQIQCILRDNDKQRVYKQVTLCHPDLSTFWYAVFDLRKVHLNGPYSLELIDDEIGKSIQKSEQVYIDDTFATTITYPASGGTVSQSFTAYGPTNQTQISASMVLGAYSELVVGVINQTSWHAVFTGIPAGTGYVLNVFDSQNGSGTPSDTHNSITVTTVDPGG